MQDTLFKAYLHYGGFHGESSEKKWFTRKTCVSGYDSQFQDGKGNRLLVMANLDSTGSDWSFGVNEGEAYEAVTVVGMKNALYVGSGDGGTLLLLIAGIAPIRVLDAFAPVSANRQDGAEVYDSHYERDYEPD